MQIKKTILISLAALAAAGIVAGCGSDKKPAAGAGSAEKATTIKVGVSPVPPAEI